MTSFSSYIMKLPYFIQKHKTAIFKEKMDLYNHDKVKGIANFILVNGSSLPVFP